MAKRPFTVSVIDSDEIPDWERKPPKWTDIVEEVLALVPGKALKLEFSDRKTAERARNAVRDTANLRERTIAVRTRLVNKPDGTSTVYIVRLDTSST